jgi:hypothetical protein
MKCPACGHENRAGAKFYAGCPAPRRSTPGVEHLWLHYTGPIT